MNTKIETSACDEAERVARLVVKHMRQPFTNNIRAAILHVCSTTRVSLPGLVQSKGGRTL